MFNLGYDTIPFYLKTKYEDLNNLIGIYFENPEEFRVNKDQFLLVLKDFTIMEQFADSIINTFGKVRILFNSKFQITHFEFVSTKHNEIFTNQNRKSVNCINEYGITPQQSRILIISEAITNMIPKIKEQVEQNM